MHHPILQMGLLRLRKVKAFALQGHTATEWNPGSMTGRCPLLTMAPYSLSEKVTDTDMGRSSSKPSCGITEINGSHLG